MNLHMHAYIYRQFSHIQMIRLGVYNEFINVCIYRKTDDNNNFIHICNIFYTFVDKNVHII
jgi:hypothetical protein